MIRILCCFVFAYYTGICDNVIYAQNLSLKLKIHNRDRILKIQDRIRNYPEFSKISDVKVRDSLEAQFVPYFVNYVYSDISPVYFCGYVVQNLVASVSKKNKIAAIHISFAYSESIIDSLTVKYGNPVGVKGLIRTDNYAVNGNDFGIYMFANGRVSATIYRNSLFYSEISNMKDLITISFLNANGNREEYLSLYNNL